VNRILVFRIYCCFLFIIFARHLILKTYLSTVNVDKYVITVDTANYLSA